MSRKSRKNVGLIGLGIIGTRVAAGLRAAGYQVYVWNRSAKPAPNFLGSPAEVADSAEIIQIFVSDAAALFEVIENMGDSLTPKHIVVCSATVGPEAVLEAAQIVETKGAQFLDAPFTGSKLAAEKRQLVYYIGGAEHTFLKAKPVLEATSKAIVRIGEVGHAASVKVVTNMISAVTAQVLAEALSIVQKAGLPPEVLAAAIEHNACRSGVIDLKLPKMIAGDYDAHFSLKHMFKDVQLGIHMANALDIEIPATTVTAGVMYGALNQGWADLDFSALFKNYTAIETEEDLPALPPAAAAAFADEVAMIEPLELKNAAPPVPKDIPVPTPDAGPGNIITQIGNPAIGGGRGESNSSADLPETAPSPTSSPIIDAALSYLATEREKQSGSPEEKPLATTKAADESQTPAPESGAGGGAPPNQPPPSPEKPANSGEEAPSRANNFVRRWFVARSGG